MLQKEYNGLWEQGKLNEALAKVLEAAKLYPEEDYTIQLDLAALYLELNRHQEAKEILQSAFDQGYWFTKVFIQPFFQEETFSELTEQWERLREEAEGKATAKSIIITPKDYDPTRSYPVFVALHGWGEDAAFFSQYWNSEKITNEYILIFPQSSQIIGYQNYCWDQRELAFEEITELIQQAQREDLLDLDQVIVGGFSQGGALAMDYALNQEQIPVKGFISLCPPKMEQMELDHLKAAGAEKGMKGVIITGDQDPCIADQREMVKRFEQANFAYQFVIEEGLGHWFPEKLGQYLKDALDFIA